MKKIILLFAFILSLKANAVQPFSLDFIPVYRMENVVFGKNYFIADSDSVRIETLRFYISGLSFYKNDKLVFSEPDSYHLIDLSEYKKLPLSINLPENISFDHIIFNLGIDSITNNSGVMGKDLDPTKGMYWTWQTGYINLKLEGTCSICKSRGNEFQFHLGGYAYPFNSLREINIPTPDNSRSDVTIDLKRIFDSINFTTETHVMSPGANAMQLSTLISECFKSKW